MKAIITSFVLVTISTGLAACDGCLPRGSSPAAAPAERKPSSRRSAIVPTRPSTRAQAERMIRAAGPVPAGADLRALLRPTIAIDTASSKPGALTGGASRFGGVPDVPPGFEWPTHVPPRDEAMEQMMTRLGEAIPPQARRSLPDGKTSFPLTFLAQLDLSALSGELRGFEAAGHLPDSGFLYFFYDPSHGGWGFDPGLVRGYRVIYVGEAARSTLAPAKPPAGLPADAVFPACGLTFHKAFQLPSYGDDRLEDLGLPEDDATFESYGDLRGRLLGHGEYQPRHLLLGHPDIIQNDMRLEVQLVSHGLYVGDASGYQDPSAKALEVGAGDWNLLLQIDSDDECPGWMWGDLGRLYFWIRDEDLRAKRFEKARMVLQCH